MPSPQPSISSSRHFISGESGLRMMPSLTTLSTASQGQCSQRGFPHRSFEYALRYLVLCFAKTLLEVPDTTCALTIRRNSFSPNEVVSRLTQLFSRAIKNFMLVGSFGFLFCFLALYQHRSWMTVQRPRSC